MYMLKIRSDPNTNNQIARGRVFGCLILQRMKGGEGAGQYLERLVLAAGTGKGPDEALGQLGVRRRWSSPREETNSRHRSERSRRTNSSGSGLYNFASLVALLGRFLFLSTKRPMKLAHSSSITFFCFSFFFCFRLLSSP
jgi:hypothetical protein